MFGYIFKSFYVRKNVTLIYYDKKKIKRVLGLLKTRVIHKYTFLKKEEKSRRLLINKKTSLTYSECKKKVFNNITWLL